MLSRGRRGEVMEKVKLVQPDTACDEVAEIFDDIRKTKGANFLTPTWGFFALDIELLRGWWTLTKRLQTTPGSLPKPLLNAISLVCAAEVDCPRCINNHQTHLIQHFGMSTEDVMACMDFENASTLDPMWKDVLRFARKVAFDEGTEDSDFQALRDHGIDDVGIAEIVSMAMLESGMARHAAGGGAVRERRSMAEREPAVGDIRRKRRSLARGRHATANSRASVMTPVIALAAAVAGLHSAISAFLLPIRPGAFRLLVERHSSPSPRTRPDARPRKPRIRWA